MAKKYKFSLFLFGESQKHKETMHKAIVNSLAEYKEFTYKQKSKKLKIKSYTPIVKLSFLTPLRIKKQNRFARKDIELLDILLSIHRRYLDLQSLPYEKVQLDTEYKIVTKNLYYQELTRRSNKQNTKMNLGGLMGEIVVSGVSKEVYELLKIGEVIGAGKNPVFGLGKIKVEEIK
jgi:CRISPR-associated endoribonuclease Cas6